MDGANIGWQLGSAKKIVGGAVATGLLVTLAV